MKTSLFKIARKDVIFFEDENGSLVTAQFLPKDARICTIIGDLTVADFADITNSSLF